MSGGEFALECCVFLNQHSGTVPRQNVTTSTGFVLLLFKIITFPGSFVHCNMEDDIRFGKLGTTLQDVVRAALEHGEISSDRIDSILASALDTALPQLAEDLLGALKKRAPAMLKDHRTIRRGFVARNRKRWKDGFDKLEMFIVISEELGAEINSVFRSEAVETQDHKFEALTSLHARAVRVAREIMSLMLAGFPDGALGRWRTLHEISVVAHFLSVNEGQIANRYLLHRTIESYKAAKQYREFERAANLEPFDKEAFDRLEQLYKKIVERHGTEMASDWGWTAPVLSKRPSFRDIEEYCGLNHWRPRYKWSSQDTHANHVPHATMLALSETKEEVLLVGESNSGMTDPAQMTTASLLLATSATVSLSTSLDHQLGLYVLRLLNDEIGETFFRIEKGLEENRCQPD